MSQFRWRLGAFVLRMVLSTVHRLLRPVKTSPLLPPDQRPAWASVRPLPVARRKSCQPLIVGHRGAMGLAPENTLAGLRVAAELGIDAVEFDVQRTRDGHLVLFHDRRVDRTTGGTGLLAEKTLADVKALDAGQHFAARFVGERIPTLDEALAYLKTTDLLLLLELKDPWRYDGIEAQVVDCVRAHDLVGRVQVHSFHHAALHEIHRRAPEIALAELWYHRLPGNRDVVYKTVSALHWLYTPQSIARLHEREVAVIAWTADTIPQMRRLIRAEIDGVCTNFPDRMVTLLEEIERQ